MNIRLICKRYDDLSPEIKKQLRKLNTGASGRMIPILDSLDGFKRPYSHGTVIAIIDKNQKVLSWGIHSHLRTLYKKRIPCIDIYTSRWYRNKGLGTLIAKKLKQKFPGKLQYDLVRTSIYYKLNIPYHYR